MSSYDFSKTESAKPGNYMKPGVHPVKISEVEEGEFEDSQIPYVAVTFQAEDGNQLVEKFVLKTKDPNSKTNPLARLQYLHEAWTGKLLAKAFKSVEEIVEYFKKVFVNPKAGTRNLLVGGEINGSVTYGRVPYTGFIVPEDADIEVGEFEEGDENWKKYVKKSTRVTEAAGKKGGLLNDTDDDNDLPFGGKDEKKKTGKASTKKDEAKTSKKKNEEVEDDGEDLPW